MMPDHSGPLRGFAALALGPHPRPACRTQDKRRAAVDAITHLIPLLREMQRHRGMCAAWRGGDATAQASLEALRPDINQQMGMLAALTPGFNISAVSFGTPAALSTLRHRWETLIAALPSMSAEESNARHGFLIAQAFSWLESHAAAFPEETPGHLLMGNVTQRLPQLAIALDDIRATGCTVAVRCGCSPKARVSLMLLIARAETLLARMPGHHADLDDDAYGQVRQQLARLTRVVRADMLMSGGVTVPAPEFFAQATACIDAVFMWIEACIAIVDAALPSHPATMAQTNLV